MDDFIADLRSTVESASTRLRAVSERESSVRPAPGKWSKKEIVGHLIDSASNNHQRFVRAQFTSELVFPGYDQNEWVRVQHYQELDWLALVELWRGFNLHIAHVMEKTMLDVRMRARVRHNLHQIAWQTVAESQPTTLDYFMRDYVAHLKHHLRQAGVV